jgi:hypothetical protein
MFNRSEQEEQKENLMTLSRPFKTGQNPSEPSNFSEISELFKTYCDKFRPLDRKTKVHLKKVRDITQKWKTPIYKAHQPLSQMKIGNIQTMKD